MSDTYDKMERSWKRYMEIVAKCDRLLNDAHDEWVTAKDAYERERERSQQ